MPVEVNFIQFYLTSLSSCIKGIIIYTEFRIMAQVFRWIVILLLIEVGSRMSTDTAIPSAPNTVWRDS